MTHTPGFWLVEQAREQYFSIRTLAGQARAYVDIADVYGWHNGRRSVPVAKANAHRIVACVNGCDGLNPAGFKAALLALHCAISVLQPLAPDDATRWPELQLIKNALALATRTEPTR